MRSSSLTNKSGDGKAKADGRERGKQKVNLRWLENSGFFYAQKNAFLLQIRKHLKTYRYFFFFSKRLN